MSPGIKYGLARVGLFVAVAVPAALAFRDVNLLIVLMIALLVSAILSFVLPPLRRWRDEVAGQLSTSVARRAAEKERLRAALAGEDEPDDKAPTA